MRNGTLPVMAGNPPADAAQPSGMNGMIVTVPMNDAQEPRAPRIPNRLCQNPRNEGWVYEEKVDGYRILAHKDGERVRLISRHAKDLTARFPELVEALRTLRPDSIILDREVAVYDERLVSRFEWLRAQPKDEVATR